MIGIPSEKKADLMEKIQFIERNVKHIDSVKLYIFQLRRGTPILSIPDKYGIKPRPTPNTNRFIEYDGENGYKWEQIIENQKKELQEFEDAMLELNVPIIIPELYFMKLMEDEI